MKTSTITAYAAGVTINAGQQGVIPVELYDAQNSLYNKEFAIFGLSYTIHCYAGVPATTPYYEIAFTKGLRIPPETWLFFTGGEFPRMLLHDAFNSNDKQNYRQWPDIFPHEVKLYEQIHCGLFVDNSAGAANITPSYRIEVSIDWENLSLVKKARGF